MFDQLMESQPQSQRRTSQMLLSIAVHTVLIAVSIQLTRAAAESLAKRPPEVPMLLTRAPTPPVVSHAAAAAAAAVSSAPALLALPPAPLVVPVSIPTVESGRTFDVSRYDTRGTGHGGTSTLDGAASGDTIKALTLQQVDDPVEYLDGPSPVYPPALREIGVTGQVTLRYIVGADGRAEDSIAVTRSTNRAFEAPAIAAVRQSRFKAAKVRGAAVRQIVEQVVRFTIGGPGRTN
jgi:TonB family protein